MFSVLKKFTKAGDDRCSAPVPMSSSLQKKFSKGVHFNMKILIKGDRNVGKSCLLQRLQGGPFIENYVPTEQIQAAPIHWTYKNSDHIVKVEVWEVVDKGRTKKKPPLGLKLENQSSQIEPEDGLEIPVLDATFLDVYKNANGVILMFDITKPWTFDYVVKELTQVPADFPVVVLGNHCDMQHHRQVHSHHIEQAMYQAKLTRTAPVRYAESSMRNGFGLRFLHKFLSIPFLRLQRTSLLEQLQRNQKDSENAEQEIDEFQSSEEAHYATFVERLAERRRSGADPPARSDHAPSIVLGAGKPIVPPGVNPLLAQSLNPKGIKAQNAPTESPELVKQSQYVNPELLKPKHLVSMEMTPPRPLQQESAPSTPVGPSVLSPSGALDEFYAGTLDSSFLEDLTPLPTASQDISYGSDSDDGNSGNPMVTVVEDDLDVDISPMNTKLVRAINKNEEVSFHSRFSDSLSLGQGKDIPENRHSLIDSERENRIRLSMDSGYPIWAGDSSARRSPEGGEDSDLAKEADEKIEKKHKKKKCKDKEKGDYSDKSERREKKSKHKKSKGEKQSSNTQQGLLVPNDSNFNYDDYDSI